MSCQLIKYDTSILFIGEKENGAVSKYHNYHLKRQYPMLLAQNHDK